MQEKSYVCKLFNEASLEERQKYASTKEKVYF